MGEVRWQAPLRSWVGIVIGTLITVPGVGRLVGGIGVLPLNLVILFGGLVVLVPSALLRLVVADEGIEIWPVHSRLRWDAVESFEATGTIAASVRAHRRNVARPATLTVQPIRPKHAADLVDRLNDELARAKRTS